jgi:hypothetical protein
MIFHDDFLKRVFDAKQLEVAAKHMRLGDGTDHNI